MIRENLIEQFEKRDTPFYYYDISGLNAHVKRVQALSKESGYHLHYAMKANATAPVLEVMRSNGLGVDCVSGQEVEAALEAGFEPNQIAFAGVGKTDHEIESAINHNIFSINVESIEELQVIEKLASKCGKVARVALRLNPDVDAKTHRYITTGLEENKFGISPWQIQEVMEFLRGAKHLDVTGLHFHIGSQIRSLEPFRNLCGRMNDLNELFLEAGFNIRHLNAGGGLGINYDEPDGDNNPDFNSFFQVFKDLLRLRPNQELHFELGRALVANYGDLISRVLFVKRGLKTNFLILDAGMTELLRPALYQSVHAIENLSNQAEDKEVYDVVGPVCESSDCFGKAIVVSKAKRGDLIAIRSAGAYGESMASHYNLRSLRPSFVD